MFHFTVPWNDQKRISNDFRSIERKHWKKRVNVTLVHLCKLLPPMYDAYEFSFLDTTTPFTTTQHTFKQLSIKSCQRLNQLKNTRKKKEWTLFHVLNTTVTKKTQGVSSNLFILGPRASSILRHFLTFLAIGLPQLSDVVEIS